MILRNHPDLFPALRLVTLQKHAFTWAQDFPLIERIVLYGRPQSFSSNDPPYVLVFQLPDNSASSLVAPETEEACKVFRDAYLGLWARDYFLGYDFREVYQGNPGECYYERWMLTDNPPDGVNESVAWILYEKGCGNRAGKHAQLLAADEPKRVFTYLELRDSRWKLDKVGFSCCLILGLPGYTKDHRIAIDPVGIDNQAIEQAWNHIVFNVHGKRPGALHPKPFKGAPSYSPKFYPVFFRLFNDEAGKVSAENTELEHQKLHFRAGDVYAFEEAYGLGRGYDTKNGSAGLHDNANGQFENVVWVIEPKASPEYIADLVDRILPDVRLNGYIDMTHLRQLTTNSLPTIL